MALMSIKRIIFSSIIFNLSELLAHLMHGSLESRIYKWHFEWHTRIQCELPKHMHLFNYGHCRAALMGLPVTLKFDVLKYFDECVS